MTRHPVDVAVLGATGFIGSRLCRHLVEAGLSVRAVARRANAAHGAGKPCILPPHATEDDWVTAVEGARCAINLVGLAHFAGPDNDLIRELFATNVATTDAITRACARASVERVIYMSSIKAIAESSSRPLTSCDTGAPTTIYGGTKRAGELLTAAGMSRGSYASIVRVPMVYGQGAQGNLARVARGVRRGMPFPRPSREGLRSLCSLERLVVALHGLTVADRPPRLIHICDPCPLQFSDIVRSVALGLELTARFIAVPTPILSTTLGAVGKRDTVQRWTQNLLVASDGFENYPPTDSLTGTLNALSRAAPTFA